MRLLLTSAALLALSVEAFQPTSSNLLLGSHSSTTTLFGTNQFSNGGYDASNLQSVKWTPREASEFIIWHMSDNFEEMGRQLTPLIQTWSGKDLGEFLSRLYLGETTDDFEISFESRNVRTPQWMGLDSEEGILALKDLLRTALSDELLKDPIEMASVAEVFLWKEHTWPAAAAVGADVESKELERDSFASQGYTGTIVGIWMELREERGQKRNFLYSAEDVLKMVPTPSKEWGSIQLKGMQDFFVQMGIRLAPSCKVELVQGMATSGWNPGKIAKFVSNIPEIAEDVKKIRASVAIEQEKEKQEEEEKAQGLQAPPPPMENNHLDNVASYTKYVKTVEDEQVTNDDKQKIQLPAPNVKSGVNEVLEAVKKTQEFYEGNIKPAQTDALEAVRRKILASKQKNSPWQ